MIEYVLGVDKRIQYKAIYNYELIGNMNGIFTLIIDLIVLMLLFYLLTIFNVSAPMLKYAVYSWSVSTIINTFNVVKTTAYRLRVSPLRYVLKRLSLIPRIIIFRMPYIDKKDLQEAAMCDINRRINKYNLQWHQLDRKYMKSKNEVDQYWVDLGLDVEKFTANSQCVRIKAKEPINPQIDSQYYFDARDHLPESLWLKTLTQDWRGADMSDKMHVQSLKKRVCGPKYEVDLDAIGEMDNTLNNTLTKMKKHKKTRREYIIKALGTQGTAGQFSKGSDYEDMWKNKNSMESCEIWEKMVAKIFDICMTTNRLPEEIIEYMLYRKR